VEVAAEPAAMLSLLQGRLQAGQAVKTGVIRVTNLDALFTFLRCIDWSVVSRRLRTDRISLGLVAAEEVCFLESPDYVDTAARMLAAGKIIAWFQEGSEFGPRALGRRSLLADPRRPEMRDIINREIKRREDFRPFAPSVLLEDAARYFDCHRAYPYMLAVAPVRPEWSEVLRSVVHRDGSSRLQTVTRGWNSTYHSLLRAFRRLAGISVLLNTSLNRRGMPIVETPEDALNFFRETPRLDALVIDRFVVWHQPRPPLEAMADLVPADHAGRAP
jgi:predicted NodU family carbamoyl transferase